MDSREPVAGRKRVFLKPEPFCILAEGSSFFSAEVRQVLSTAQAGYDGAFLF